ncbi:MAG: hypothetical protein ACRDQZ_25735 [Mycobacteriales bacterium]
MRQNAGACFLGGILGQITVTTDAKRDPRHPPPDQTKRRRRSLSVTRLATPDKVFKLVLVAFIHSRRESILD